jgi:predicted transposase/invertase (TIGR01784 family)
MPNQTGPGDGPPSPDPPVPPPSDLKPPGRKLTPHDSIFRRIFGMTGNAASQLRSVLPPDVATRLDLSRLVPAPGSFVDEALKWKHADLLFTVSTMDGQDAFVYVLMEHQSTDDPLMAFRVLRYVTRIWDRYLEEHPRARRLPAVIPFVVHNGRGRWTSPVQLPDLIDLGPADKKAMETYLPRFEFLLDDLADIDLWQLRDRELTPLARITLVLLKTAPGNRRIRTELSDPAASLGPDAETY